MFCGKNKALTFSYDDGVYQDARLAEIFNKYGMKCTFNLNSGLFSPENNWLYKGAMCAHMKEDELKKALKGHEIAVHGVKHLDITALSAEEKRAEIMNDKLTLEKTFGAPVYGMAYAYGAFDGETKRIAAECGIKYSRTVRPSHSFGPQADMLEFNPTCHHSDTELFKLAEEFISLPADTNAVFYVWGHSYEFDGDNNWNLIEDFCKLMSGRDDIFYGTNTEVLLNR